MSDWKQRKGKGVKSTTECLYDSYIDDRKDQGGRRPVHMTKWKVGKKLRSALASLKRARQPPRRTSIIIDKQHFKESAGSFRIRLVEKAAAASGVGVILRGAHASPPPMI